MPPPTLVRPLLTVRPEIVMMPDWRLKMRKPSALLPVLRWIVRLLAPGPRMARSLLMSSSPLVKMIAPVIEKPIISPGGASAMACRSVPGPLSAVFVTVAACPGPESRLALRQKRIRPTLLIVVLRSWREAHSLNRSVFRGPLYEHLYHLI